MIKIALTDPDGGETVQIEDTNKSTVAMSAKSLSALSLTFTLPTVSTLLSNIAGELRYRMGSSNVYTQKQVLEILSQIHPLINNSLAQSIFQSLVLQDLLKIIVPCEDPYSSIIQYSSPTSEIQNIITTSESNEEVSIVEHKLNMPTGVFPQLTCCYSPTCNDQCYTLFCPRQSAPKTTKKLSKSLHLKVGIEKNSHELWADVVSPTVLATIGDHERKRQEVIFEIIKTEKEYVNDLKILKKYYVDDLLRSDIIPKERKHQFVAKVFSNLDDLIRKNGELMNALVERQQEKPIVEEVGDIFDEWTAELNAYVLYGENQAVSKHTLDEELESNLLFLKFCESNERLPECRKLPLQSFLSRVTTRLGRYPILLETLIKRTNADSSDKHLLQASIDKIRDILNKINDKAGMVFNTVRLQYLIQHLYVKPGTELLFDMRLADADRRIIREGVFKRKKKTTSTHKSFDSGDLYVFLLDNCLLICKKKTIEGKMMLQVKKQPIPLYLLCLNDPHDLGSLSSLSSTIQKTDNVSPSLSLDSQRGARELTVELVGKNGFSYTMVASYAQCKQWLADMESAKEALQLKMRIYDCSLVLGISEANQKPSFLIDNRIYCSVYLDGYLLLGTKTGIVSGKIGSPRTFTQLFECRDIIQMEIVLAFNIFLVLSDKYLLYFKLNELRQSLEDRRPLKGVKMAGSLSFFKVGKIKEHTVLITVKSKLLSTYIKIHDYNGVPDGITVKRKNSLAAMIRRISMGKSYSEFVTRREIYIPSETLSLHFLKTKLCIGCHRGFELIDIETLETQALINSSDKSLSFLEEVESMAPLALYKVNNEEYLLCYQEFGIYVDKMGTNSRKSVKCPHIEWVGKPKAFHGDAEYLLAFDNRIIEIRNLQTSELLQVFLFNDVYMSFSLDSTIQFSSVNYYSDKVVDTNNDNSNTATSNSSTGSFGRRLSRVLSALSTEDVDKLIPPDLIHRNYVSSLWTLTRDEMELKLFKNLPTSPTHYNSASFENLPTISRMGVVDVEINDSFESLPREEGSSSSSIAESVNNDVQK